MGDVFERKAYGRLRAWKAASRGRAALRLEGARRVGKTTLAREFGRREYDSFLLIDFTRVPEGDAAELFESTLVGPGGLELFFEALPSYASEPESPRPLVERRSLIIFDEIQACPSAREKVDLLVEDGRYDYITTGSLISIRENRGGVRLPSSETSIRLDPLDFEEFLWALGKRDLSEGLRRRCVDLLRLERTQDPGLDPHFDEARRLVRQYMAVGGMPQAVLPFARGHGDGGDLGMVERAKRDINGLYRDDIRSHVAPGQRRLVQLAFEGLPRELSANNSRRSRDPGDADASLDVVDGACHWLSDAFIVNPCNRCTEPMANLGSKADPRAPKWYMADTGLLVSLSFGSAAVGEGELTRAFIEGGLRDDEGLLVENYVAQCLGSSLGGAGVDDPLWYWTGRSGGDGGGAAYEVDFLMELPVGRPETGCVAAIEAKAGRSYTKSSLTEFRRRYGSDGRCGRTLILAPRNPGWEGEHLRLPLYYAMYLYGAFGELAR